MRNCTASRAIRAGIAPIDQMEIEGAMKTCASIQCPFIAYCKQYSNNHDRSDGCKTQRLIIDQAMRLQKTERQNVHGGQHGIHHKL